MYVKIESEGPGPGRRIAVGCGMNRGKWLWGRQASCSALSAGRLWLRVEQHQTSADGPWSRGAFPEGWRSLGAPTDAVDTGDAV